LITQILIAVRKMSILTHKKFLKDKVDRMRKMISRADIVSKALMRKLSKTMKNFLKTNRRKVPFF
jgi:hypothetical protein